MWKHSYGQYKAKVSRVAHWQHWVKIKNTLHVWNLRTPVAASCTFSSLSRIKGAILRTISCFKRDGTVSGSSTRLAKLTQVCARSSREFNFIKKIFRISRFLQNLTSHLSSSLSPLRIQVQVSMKASQCDFNPILMLQCSAESCTFSLGTLVSLPIGKIDRVVWLTALQ